MGRRLQTIYEYFSDYSEKEIDDMIHSLSIEEKLIIRERYGNDLHNPQVGEKWGKESSEKFYGTLIPKMKRLLAKGIEQPEKKTSVEESKIIIPEEPKVVIPETPKIEVIDYTPMLMQLLKEGKNNKEICENLKIDSNQLYEELLKLRNKGIRHSRKYYSDGSIKYHNISTMQDLRNYNGIGQDRTIITDTNENSMKVLLISDLHFGNELERLDLIERAYNYCIKNGISIILCGGDIIDGAYTKGTQKISDLYQQIEYFIKNYPYDKSILTFSVAGDHDISAFNTSSLDIIEMCNNYRHDIIIGGYNNTGINLKNDKVHLYHHVEAGAMRQTDAPIILHGHSHKYTTEIKNNSLNITIPTLSGINQPMPSALELNLYFSKGYIANSVIKHIYFGTQDVVLSESTFDLLKGRTINYEAIKNIETFRQGLTQPEDPAKTLKKVNQPLSQIEKFNRRYGK